MPDNYCAGDLAALSIEPEWGDGAVVLSYCVRAQLSGEEDAWTDWVEGALFAYQEEFSPDEVRAAVLLRLGDEFLSPREQAAVRPIAVTWLRSHEAYLQEGLRDIQQTLRDFGETPRLPPVDLRPTSSPSPA